MAKKFQLTGLGKTIAIALVVAAVGAVVYFSGLTKKLVVGTGGSDKADITICVNTYTGFAPILYLNNGTEPTKDCPFYEKYGMTMRIIIMDDFAAARAALEQGKVDVEYCTLDALPVDQSSQSPDNKYFMLLNFSNGADAIVATKGINSTKDLKGKRVAYAEGTASHTLLYSALESNGMNMDDIIPIKVESGVAAAELFRTGRSEVDACVLYSPDDISCTKAIPGSKVITSTAIASNLVSDGLIANTKWLDNNKEKVSKLVEGVLWANSEVKNNKEAFNKACELFARDFGTDVEYAQQSAKGVNFATLEDNLNWFGLNPEYTGMVGERIYSKMARLYTNLGLTHGVRPWKKVSDSSIIEMVAENNSLDNKQTALGTAEKDFSVPTPEMATKQEISDKKVTINFPVNGYALDEDAKNTITREFVDIAQSYPNVRIRVEGNTDNTGNYDSNVALSKARAQAVVNYLVKEYGMNKNRFITVGNGPKKAISDNVSGSNEAYRTTDFQLIAD